MNNTKPEIEYTSYTQVTETSTANYIGSGDLAVYATPAMAALMENAAMNAALVYMKNNDMKIEELTTVGISLNISHEKASKVGKTIKSVAKLIGVEGKKLTFNVFAYEGDLKDSATDWILIGQGVHERFIVNVDKFLSKLQ